jgi:FkbM family methyltransferase
VVPIMPVSRLRDLFSPADRVRYLAWRALKARTPLRVKLPSGLQIILRSSPAMDLSLAYEIFVAECYRTPPGLDLGPVRRIIDVGGNVGFSTVYWTGRFPGAHVLVFEPHPALAAQIQRHIELNQLGDRVVLCDRAAGTSEGTLYLTDAEVFSTLVSEPGHDDFEAIRRQHVADGGTDTSALRERIPVRMVDFLTAVGPEPIDLLKVDIEGGEHAILDDPRFGALPVQTLVMEWHDSPEYADGFRHCVERLEYHGYRASGAPVTEAGARARPGQRAGILWARRDRQPTR